MENLNENKSRQEEIKELVFNENAFILKKVVLANTQTNQILEEFIHLSSKENSFLIPLSDLIVSINNSNSNENILDLGHLNRVNKSKAIKSLIDVSVISDTKNSQYNNITLILLSHLGPEKFLPSSIFSDVFVKDVYIYTIDQYTKIDIIFTTSYFKDSNIQKGIELKSLVIIDKEGELDCYIDDHPPSKIHF